MSISTKLNTLKTFKSNLKSAIEAKGINIDKNTPISDYVSKVNNIQTSSESLAILSNIKDSLIAIGVGIDNDTPYSEYANIIGGLSMGYEKVLINNGTNGWYLIDRKTNWVKLCYRHLTSTTDATEYKTGLFVGEQGSCYWKAVSLPFTFVWVKPVLVPDLITVTTSVETNYHASQPSVVDYTNQPNRYRLITTYNAGTESRYRISAVADIEAYIITDKMNKICLKYPSSTKNYESSSEGYTYNGINLWIYAEGMITG